MFFLYIFFTIKLQLYEDFAKSKAKKEMENSLNIHDGDDKKEKKRKGPPHVFQVMILNTSFFLIIGVFSKDNSTLRKTCP